MHQGCTTLFYYRTVKSFQEAIGFPSWYHSFCFVGFNLKSNDGAVLNRVHAHSAVLSIIHHKCSRLSHKNSVNCSNSLISLLYRFIIYLNPFSFNFSQFINQIRVKMGAAALLNNLEGLLRRDCFSIRAFGGDRVKDIGNS